MRRGNRGRETMPSLTSTALNPGQRGALRVQLATPNWFTNKRKANIITRVTYARRQVYNLYFEAKEKKHFFLHKKTNTYKVNLLWKIGCAIK